MGAYARAQRVLFRAVFHLQQDPHPENDSAIRFLLRHITTHFVAAPTPPVGKSAETSSQPPAPNRAVSSQPAPLRKPPGRRSGSSAERWRG